jgi:hypothetical protein
VRNPDAPDEPIAEFSPPETRVDDPGADLAWFREVLREKKITPHPDSFVARALDALDEMAAGIAGRYRPPPGEDQGEKIRSASGMLFLIRAVRRALEKRPDAFASKWYLFRGADIGLVAYDAGRRTLERDKMWELLVAVLCERVFHQVTLADHLNPDIRCFLRGEEWGIECKLLYSQNAGAQQDELLHKASQLEGSAIKNGVVAVNITGLLDHSVYIDTFRFFPAPEGLSREMLSVDLDRQAQAVVDRINTPGFRRRLFKNDRASGPRSCTRMILFWSQTVAFSEGKLSLTCSAKWIAYEERTLKDDTFIQRFLLAARLGGP